MTNEDSQERATAANRVRRCARLVRVSTAASAETGASTVGGAPAELRRW
jgi:hypothetical protein